MIQLTGNKLEIQPILDLILSNDNRATIDGYNVAVKGVRLTTFATKGTKCICCDTEASFFRVEDNHSGAHLNLYGIKGGYEVLFTRDHIVPHSHGGPNKVDNMNTMCLHCNNKRGTKDLEEFLSDYKAGKYKNKSGHKRGGNGKVPNQDIRQKIYEHVKLHGINSALKPIYLKILSQKSVKKILTELVNSGDELGASIAEYAIKKAGRAKVRRYILKEYSDIIVDENDSPKSITINEAFGRLKTAAKNVIADPDSEDAMSKLVDALEISKGYDNVLDI